VAIDHLLQQEDNGPVRSASVSAFMDDVTIAGRPDLIHSFISHFLQVFENATCLLIGTSVVSLVDKAKTSIYRTGIYQAQPHSKYSAHRLVLLSTAASGFETISTLFSLQKMFSDYYRHGMQSPY
jgi:hypothetical protein